MRFLLVTALCVIPALAHADDAAAYQKAVNGVVAVFSAGPKGEISRGTGVATAFGIVTARHVVGEAKAAAVLFPARDVTGAVIGDLPHYAGKIKLCAVIGTSTQRDLALLTLIEPEEIDVIPLAATSASPGDQVFTIGAGSGAALWHYASGNVRQVYQGGYAMPDGTQVRGRIIESTIPTNPGDSGGPILRNGQLVGINLAFERGSNLINEGIDVSEIKGFVAELILAELRNQAKQK